MVICFLRVKMGCPKASLRSPTYLPYVLLRSWPTFCYVLPAPIAFATKRPARKVGPLHMSYSIFKKHLPYVSEGGFSVVAVVTLPLLL